MEEIGILVNIEDPKLKDVFSELKSEWVLVSDVTFPIGIRKYISLS